ncbi:MAG: AmmeMemoRadiSam system protein A [Gammaproteobacteria bacterium]|nr:AmmeMemoRadiSam system protein A [Gammaproteobacteria bacterium]
MHSIDQLSQTDRVTLLDTARRSILHGLTHQLPLPVHITDYTETLTVKRACFVTLLKNQQLRGCIGSLQASKALITDVSNNAFSAAFKDFRFDPVNREDIDLISIHLSILSEPEPIMYDSDQDLINKIRPGIDGLILTKAKQRGTFLPSVWESIQDPEQFLQQLKCKAGLDKNDWSEQIKISRYTTETIHDDT